MLRKCGILFIGLLLNSDVVSADQVSTIGRIREGLANRYRSINNLTINYLAKEHVINGRQPPGLRGETSEQRDISTILGDKRLAFEWLQVEHRIDGQRRFLHARYPSIGVFGKSLDDAGLSGQVLSWNGKEQRQLENHGRFGFVSAQSTEHPFDSLVFRYLDWSTSKFDLRDKENTFLPQSLSPDAVVIAGSDIVEGCNCIVVGTPGLDKLWIDESKNYALIRRELQFRDGRRRQVTRATGWTNPTDTIWLPSNIIRDFYSTHTKAGRDLAAPNTIETRVSIAITCKATRLADEAFSVQFPPGAIVSDHVRGIKYQNGTRRGEDPIELALRLVENFDGSGGRGEGLATRVSAVPVLLNVAFILAISLLIGVRLLGRGARSTG